MTLPLRQPVCPPRHVERNLIPDYFGLAPEVAALETQAAASTGLDRCHDLCFLAWYLRQRDSHRAERLVAEAWHLLDQEGGVQGHPRLAARLMLAEAETRYLFGDLAGAQEHATAARSTLEGSDDLTGIGDALMCTYMLTVDRGESDRIVPTLEAALDSFRHAGDRPRSLLAHARLAQWAVIRSPRDAATVRALVELTAGNQHPGVTAAVRFVQAWHHSTGLGDFKGAIQLWLEVFDTSLQAGAGRQAVTACCNSAVAYNNLGDNATSLEWAEKGIDMARRLGWPASLGTALSQGAQILREAGNAHGARELLLNAVEVLAPFPHSRNYALMCPYVGQSMLTTDDPEGALHWFTEAEVRARRLRSPEIVMSGLRGQAEALSRMNRVEEALAAAHKALDDPPNDSHRYEGLRVMALLARRHALPLPAGATAPSAPIHYLEQALKAFRAMQGSEVPADLHTELAADYEAVGDLAHALDQQRLACKALEADRTKRALDMSTAMQVRYETDKARADAEHHKALAESESRRSQVLQDSLKTLEHLASIGQEITINLDAKALFAALHRHVGALLDAPFVAIFMLEGSKLVLRFGMEDGNPLPAIEVPIDDANSLAARCLREQRAICPELPDGQDAPSRIPGTRRMSSALFAPLAVHEKALGVLSIQSERKQAYAEREHRILHTLAAYAAVALANIDNARELADAQAELERERMRGLLVHTGKLATIGRLASGVIHELSHPVGALGLQTEALDALLQRDPEQAKELVPEILHELARLRTLIERLRNMARSDPPRIGPVSLRDAVKDAYRMFGPRLASEGIGHEQEVPDVAVQADADLLALAITNLVSNAMDAMAHSPRRFLSLRAARDGGDVVLTIRDTGTGLHPDVLQNLFKPFFTTKPAGVGLGLTLSAEYLAAMQASIEAINPPEGGAEFRVRLREA